MKKLKKAKIPDSSIIKVTGHSRPAGLRSYDPADEDEFRSMSNALENQPTTSENAIRFLVRMFTTIVT